MTLKAIILRLDGALGCRSHSVLETAFQRKAPAFTAARIREAGSIARTKIADPKRNPAQSNQELWWLTLKRELQLTQPVLDEIINEYHDRVLLQLEDTVPRVLPAAEVRSWLQDPSLKCAVFADVLQPEAVIRQQLCRAGLWAEGWDFIAHSANVHFDSCSPALYAEIIARLGVEADEALYIGGNDGCAVAVAQVAGLHAFGIAPGVLPAQPTRPPWKSWSDLATMLAQKDEFNELALTLNRKQVMAELRGNLGALFGLLAEVSAEQWHQHPWEEEWSITQILCHLWDREQTEHLPRLRCITEEEEPFIVAPPPPPGPEVAPCHSDGRQVALHFQSARRETLCFLEGLAETEWQKSARHSIFGPTTLLELAHFTAQHDRLHLNQLCQTLGECDS